MIQGGKTANKNGRGFEQFIKDRLHHESYLYVPRNRFFASLVLNLAIYTTQCPVGKTIYDTNRKVDFIIYHPEKHPKCLIIENKWQETNGSADEKYPYLIENVKIGEYDTIIVIDGGGYKAQALVWLKAQVNKVKQLQAVFSMSEFHKWANNPKNI